MTIFTLNNNHVHGGHTTVMRDVHLHMPGMVQSSGIAGSVDGVAQGIWQVIRSRNPVVVGVVISQPNN